MSWTEIKLAYRGLADIVHADAKAGVISDDAIQAWDGFAALATRGPSHVPYHMQAVFRHLSELDQNHDRTDISILDHGCGGGLTLLFLLANGFRGIHGLDVGGECELWNPFLARHLGLVGNRFQIYDGSTLPFEYESFDLIFSEEVIEHVHPDAIVDYYREEWRVLRPGGIVFHRVPHRLTPFDSHTRTWLIHYLPRGLWLSILRAMGQNMVTPETALFLRWPWVHRHFARMSFGNCEDQTVLRLTGMTEFTHFEGPQSLRRALGEILRIPLIRNVAGTVLRNFVMLDTVSRKPERRGDPCAR